MSAAGNVRATVSAPDWETPPELLEALSYGNAFRFTVDAAASDTNHKFPIYYTEEDSAFDHFPYGEVIFCNPPYGRGLERWIEQFNTWAVCGNTVVALLPNSTEVGWFKFMYQTADEIRLLHGRVQFIGAGNANPSGSVVGIWYPGQRVRPSPHIWIWEWKEYVSPV